MKNFFLLIGYFSLILSLSAQNRPLCTTMEMDSIRRAQNPQLGTLDDFERVLQQKIEEEKDQIGKRMLLTLPVIVHIIHNGEDPGVGTNISQAQVMSQIEVLNEDFRKMAGTPGFNNDPVGADIELEFCPATLDPNGDPILERGLRRIDRNALGLSAPPYSDTYIDNNVKPPTIWDPDRYLNIWVVEITGNVLGFAQFPNTAGLTGLPDNNGGATTDGIVVAPTYFGRVGNVAFPYNQGRTTTHEIGHWLGIFHLEGRDRGGCSQDDFVADTPETDAKNFGCDVGHVSCGTTDMVRNYMDASDDACMNIFTEDQKTRMRTVLNNSPRRAIIANSNSCTEDLPPAVAFNVSSSIVCEGQSVRFSDVSVNDPTEWNWSFPGGTPSTSTDKNPVVSYANEGTYTVTLEAGNGFGTRTLIQTDRITVNSSDPSIVFQENFDNGIPANWTVDNPDGAITWDTRDAGGSRSGDNTAYVQLYFYAATGARDGLITPTIDLGGISNINLNFDYVYRQETGSERDSLIIYASTDGGNTFPHVLIRMGDDGSQSFATGVPTGSNPGPFVPSNDDDWCFSGSGADCVELDLTAFEGETQFALRFETVSDFGNNIYLDNVEIDGTCNLVGIAPELADRHSLKLYPNPSNGNFHVSLDNLAGEEIGLTLFNLNGQKLWEQSAGVQWGNYEQQVELERLQAGAYLVRVQVGEDVVYKKLLIQGL